jgi:hypothetical protein
VLATININPFVLPSFLWDADLIHVSKKTLGINGLKSKVQSRFSTSEVIVGLK